MLGVPHQIPVTATGEVDTRFPFGPALRMRNRARVTPTGSVKLVREQQSWVVVVGLFPPSARTRVERRVLAGEAPDTND